MKFNFLHFLVAAVVVFVCYGIASAGPKARQHRAEIDAAVAAVMCQSPAVVVVQPVAPKPGSCGGTCPCGCNQTGQCDCLSRSQAVVQAPAACSSSSCTSTVPTYYPTATYYPTGTYYPTSTVVYPSQQYISQDAMYGSSGGCANGQCGTSSRAGIFGRRR